MIEHLRQAAALASRLSVGDRLMTIEVYEDWFLVQGIDATPDGTSASSVRVPYETFVASHAVNLLSEAVTEVDRALKAAAR